MLITQASDTNGDNLVDAADFGQLAAHWAQATWWQANGDINRDEIVDGAEYGFLMGDWGLTDLTEEQFYLSVIGRTELYTGRDFDAEMWLQ